MPHEIILLIASYILGGQPCADDLLLPRTCRWFSHIVLPWLYKIDVLETLEKDKERKWPWLSPPHALLWATRFGCLSAAEASLAAIDELESMARVDKFLIFRTMSHNWSWSVPQLKSGGDRSMAQMPPSLIDAIDLTSITVLHLACSRGNSAILQVFKRHGASLKDIDMEGNSLFGYCMNGSMASHSTRNVHG